MRFARFHRVSPSALVGRFCYKIGRKTVWVDTARIPDFARRAGMGAFERQTIVPFDIFCAASATLDRESATLH